MLRKISRCARDWSCHIDMEESGEAEFYCYLENENGLALNMYRYIATLIWKKEAKPSFTVTLRTRMALP